MTNQDLAELADGQLAGDKDVSMAVHEIAPYVGADNDWMLALSGFPHHLRSGGYLYLRTEGSLRARARVQRMEWREGHLRPWRTGDGAETGANAGDGWVFRIDPTTWQLVEFPLDDLAPSQRSGYRYLITSEDGSTVRYLSADDVPDAKLEVSESGSPSQRNPNWTWDEQILAFDLYIRRGLLGSQDPEVIELSQLLCSLPIHPEETRTATFRNPNGVARKLSDIHTHRPDYDGRRTSGSKLDEEVWQRFGECSEEAAALAGIIRASASTMVLPAEGEAEFDDSHRKGRITYRLHRARELDPKLRHRKIKSVIQAHGFLFCEGCDERLCDRYGDLGDQLYECHHLVPLHISGPTTTTTADVSLLCPSCHRAAHRISPWPNLDDLRASVLSATDTET